MRLHRSIQMAATIATAAALTACGGGGGGEDSGNGLPRTASEVTGDFDTGNYADVAASAASSLAPSSMLANFGRSGLTQTASVAGDRSTALAANDDQRRSALRAQAQAAYEETQACPGGGSVRGVINDVDNNEDISAGDTWAEAYTNCVVEGLVLNGGAQVTVRSASASSLDVAVSINQLSVGSATLHGTGSLALSLNGSSSSATLAFASMSLAVSGADTVTLGHTTSFAYNDSTRVATLALDGPVAIGGESFWFDQGASFALPFGKNVPRSGELAILDKDGDRVLIVGTATGLRYDFYKAGSTTPDATQNGPVAD